MTTPEQKERERREFEAWVKAEDLRPGMNYDGGGEDWAWNSDDLEWCPTEPGTFPLATGVTARVLKLRGYGDSIVAQVAAEFIKASEPSPSLSSGRTP